MWQDVGALVATLLRLLTSPHDLIVIVAGLLYGMVFGLLPGVTVVTAAALILPLTYWMDSRTALLLIVSLYVAGIFAGAFLSILFNIPGDPQNTPTCFDGYALTRQGRAVEALATAITCSALGGLFGGVAFILFSPLLSRVGFIFGPLEYFALGLLGLSVAGGLGTESVRKGLLSACLGLIFGTVGVSETAGVTRFTFGIKELEAGLGVGSVLIGAFALGEIFNELAAWGPESWQLPVQLRARTLSLREILRMRYTVLRCALIGTLVGVLPGAGATVAAFLAYSLEKTLSREGHRFGSGVLEGVAAPETANNAAGMGTLIPLITLGIPGGAVAAVIYSMFQIHGLRPGPLFFTTSKDLIYLLYGAAILCNLLIIPVGRFEARFVVSILRLPKTILYPMVFVLAAVGAFSESNSMRGVYVMLASGFLGYAFRRMGYSIAALVLGLILAPLMEGSFVRLVLLYGDRPLSLFSRPVGVALLLAGAAIMAFTTWTATGRRQFETRSVDE
jgi:putative tricarboxylic transport membrane protein